MRYFPCDVGDPAKGARCPRTGQAEFLEKKKFFNYKAGPSESIDDASSNLVRLQMTIRDIKSSEASTDLDVALTLINSVDDEAYILAKYHFEEMKN